MSEIGSGIARMSSMLNITRIHNSLTAVSYMRRCLKKKELQHYFCLKT